MFCKTYFVLISRWKKIKVIIPAGTIYISLVYEYIRTWNSSFNFSIFIFEQLLGSPEDSDLGFLRSENAQRYIKQLPHVPKQPFSQKFPGVSPVAIDLAGRMLVFDPAKRISGETGCSCTLSSLIIYSSRCWLVVFYGYSWGSAESSIFVKSPWDQRGAYLPFSLCVRFWTIVLKWRGHKGANIGGVSQVQPRIVTASVFLGFYGFLFVLV